MRLRLRRVRNYGVTPTSKDKFARSLSDSAVAAGLAKLVDGKILFVSVKDAQQKDSPPAGSDEQDQDEPGEEHSKGRKQDEFIPTPTLFKQSWPIGGGQITFEVRVDHPLSPDALVKMASVITQAQELAALLGEGQEKNVNVE